MRNGWLLQPGLRHRADQERHWPIDYLCACAYHAAVASAERYEYEDENFPPITPLPLSTILDAA